MLQPARRAVISLLCFFSLCAQAEAQVPGTAKINDYLSKIWPLHFQDIDSALSLSEYCYRQARHTGDRKLQMRSLHMLGVIEQESGNYRRSVLYLDTAIAYARQLHDQKRLGHLYNSIGMSYHLAGNYRLGMQYVLSSAQIKEKIGDVPGTITTYINISSLYGEQGDSVNALRYARNAYDFCYRNKVADYYPEVNTAFGKALLIAGDTMHGRAYLEKALDEATKAKLPLKALPPQEELVLLAIRTKDTALVRKYLWMFDGTVRATNDRAHLPGLYFAEAQYYLMKGNPHLSERYSRIAIGLSENKVKPQRQAEMYEVYVRALEAQGKTAEEIIALKRLSQLKDSINGIDRAEAARRISAEYENQKQEREIQRLNAEQRENENKLRRKNLLIVFVVAGLVLISIFLFIVFRVYNRNRKTMVLLQLKNKEIEIKNNIITNRNRDISDSIHYARRIQDALLHDRNDIDRLFSESFILYKPKDVLSGDFYWFAEKAGKKIIAAADCTGHGIPGALLSIACNSFLNDIIQHRGITEPGRVLSELRHIVIRSLKQTGAHGDSKDGLDIALLSIDERARTIAFAGAKSPFCIVRQADGKPVLEKIDGDRRPVGYYLGKGLPFTEHTLSYNPGDAFYIFTDGYPDQFGGSDNKKFRRQALLSLLESIAQLPMKEQEEVLVSAYTQWKGDEEQTDDILVIGLRAE